MNQVQRTYIRNRVDGIAVEKLTEYRLKNTIKAQTLTNPARIRLIRAKKVKMKSDKELRSIGGYNLNLGTVFDFSEYEVKGGIDQVKYAAYSRKVAAEANKLKDSVMLGDAEEALKMIEDFENFKG